jgi:hypothetical protein
MRMGIFFGYSAMGSPARMGDTGTTFNWEPLQGIY